MRRIGISLGLLLLLLVPLRLFAYGPNVIGDFGVAVWDLPVIVDEEADVVKECPAGSSEVQVSVADLLQDAIDIWEAAPQTNLNVTLRQGTLPAISIANVCDFFLDNVLCPDDGFNSLGPGQGGTNPIVYDEDGSIAALFFGLNNRFVVLGFAGVITFNNVAPAADRKAIKGEGVINLACLKDCEEDGCSGGGLNLSFARDTAVLGFVLHELGHFFGMNHTQVNLNNDLQKADFANTPTMWAIYSPQAGGSITSLQRDDQVPAAFIA